MPAIRAVLLTTLTLARAWGAISHSTPAYSASYDPGQRSFLGSQAFVRHFTIELEHARSEYAAAIAIERKDNELYSQNEKLWKKGSLTEATWRELTRQRATSTARRNFLRDRVAALEASVAQAQQHMAISAGAPINIDRLYDEYRKEWKAQCRAVESETLYLQAELDLADYRAAVAVELEAKGALSSQKRLERETELEVAKENLKAPANLRAFCAKGFPTLEFVKKLPD